MPCQAEEHWHGVEHSSEETLHQRKTFLVKLGEEKLKKKNMR